MTSTAVKERSLRALPIVLLVVIALCQIALTQYSGLSPWSGGGFGMFSTLDHGSRRHLHAFILRPGLRREIIPQEALADEIQRLLTLPTEARLRTLARTFAATPTPDHGPATAIQIQVWQTRFDSETLTPTSQILREVVMQIEAEG